MRKARPDEADANPSGCAGHRYEHRRFFSGRLGRGGRAGRGGIWLSTAVGNSSRHALPHLSHRNVRTPGGRSHHPLPAAVRERFGFHFFAVPLFAETIIDFLVLASEIGGVCLGLQLLTGIHFSLWALPVAFLIWLLL